MRRVEADLEGCLQRSTPSARTSASRNSSPARSDSGAACALPIDTSPPRRLRARPRASGLESSLRSSLDTFRRDPSGALRDPGAARRGRDGGGVPGARHATRADCRNQGPAATPVFFGGPARALRERGEDDLPDLTPAHLCSLRRQPRGGDRVSRDGAPGGRDTVCSSREGSPAAGTGAAICGGDCRCAGHRAPAGHCAPRSEAGQRDADQVRSETARLRAGEGARAGRTGRERHVGQDGGQRHARRDSSRHVALYGAGAARRQSGGCQNGHIRLRCRSL